MARSRTLAVEIVGDAKGLSGAFNDAEKQASGFGTKITKGAGIAAVGIASMGTAAIAAGVIFGPKVLEMGASIEALGVKSATVFEGSIGDVQDWAAQNAKSMGLTESALVGAAAGFGDLLKPMGFTADQAAQMSTEALDLSGALSAWTGGTRSAAEVSEILAKAMLGERDGLKELGISISEADVQARLAKNGQEGLTGAALEQAKALATQQLIQEKSTDAQKAWNDGSMDGIKAQNEMKASMSTLTESLVTTLYPAFQAIVPVITDVVTWLGTNLPIAMAVVKDWVDANWPKIRDKIVEVLDFITAYVGGFVETVQSLWAMFGERIMTVVTNAFDFIRTQVESVLKVVRGIIDVVMGLIRGDWGQAWEGIKQILAGVWDAIGNIVKYALRTIGLLLDMAWENIKSVAKAAWDAVAGAISDGINNAKNFVKAGIDAIVEFVTGLPGRVASAVSDAFLAIPRAFKAAINGIIDAWNNLSFRIKGGPWDPLGRFGPEIPAVNFGFDTPNLPRLHSGGTAGGASFAGLADDEVAAILQRGETILTPGQTAAVARASTGNTYIVNVSAPPNVDMVALGRVVVEAVGQFEQVSGAAWRGAA
jgi:uncharacterized membrane protein YhaH (DUF805 family)